MRREREDEAPSSGSPVPVTEDGTGGGASRALPPEGGPGPDAPPGAGAGIRRVARVVLLDPRDRILLLHGCDPADPSSTWWFTPGGGLEGGESREQAARRELAEETGITQVRLGPVLWRRICSFPFDGRRWDQDEWYYLGRTSQTHTDTEGHTELERRSVTGLRWWTRQELSVTHETVYPTRLPCLLHTLLEEGPPKVSVALETEHA